MPEPCPYQATIKRVDKELFGNGNEGLSKEFVKLKTEFKEMNASVDKLATSYSALAKSQIQQDINEKAKQEARKAVAEAIKRIATIVGILAGFATVAYLILDHV